MCAKHTKTTSQKAVKKAMPPKRTPKSESDDENRSSNRSLRSTWGNRKRSVSQQSTSSSSTSMGGATPDTSPDFLGPPSSPSNSKASTNRRISSNSSRPQSYTSPGRKSRKQSKPRCGKQHAKLLMPKLPFQRVVRKILEKYGDFRVQSAALQALQESIEYFLVQMFEDCVLCCINRKRDTVNDRDLPLVRN